MPRSKMGCAALFAGQNRADRAVCHVFSLMTEKKIIGMVSLPGDEAMTFFVKNLIVREAYRGRGVGRRLPEAAESEIRKQLQSGRTATVALMSPEEAISFYKNMGFVPISSLDNGCGVVSRLI